MKIDWKYTYCLRPLYTYTPGGPKVSCEMLAFLSQSEHNGNREQADESEWVSERLLVETILLPWFRADSTDRSYSSGHVYT